MTTIKKIYYRSFQKIAYMASPFLKWTMPKVLALENGIASLATEIKRLAISKVLIISGGTTKKLGLLQPMIDGLKNEKIEYEWYDKVVPNPTFENVYEAEELYKIGKCNAIIAFGGGSPMDAAKIVGARIARPNLPIEKMKGLLKIRKTLPPLFAIPTTAGSGSETTLASVITNSAKHEKFAISDPVLIPKFVVLDPSLTLALPPDITATTGMDALTHAVEAYLGKSNTKNTKKNALLAVKLIFENLIEAYNNPSNIVARKNMQTAAFCAGVAFTRAYVGNVHAIAHALGGLYNVPHGLANAIILPLVLQYYGKSCFKKLATLAKIVGICNSNDNDEQNAKKFISAVGNMNKQMAIPINIMQIKKEDIPALALHSYKEANPFYPVPKIFFVRDFENIFKELKGQG